MKIIIEGTAETCSNFIHHVLIDALRRAGRGARFYDEDAAQPRMTLTGTDYIEVHERRA